MSACAVPPRLISSASVIRFWRIDIMRFLCCWKLGTNNTKLSLAYPAETIASSAGGKDTIRPPRNTRGTRRIPRHAITPPLQGLLRGKEQHPVLCSDRWRTALHESVYVQDTGPFCQGKCDQSRGSIIPVVPYTNGWNQDSSYQTSCIK